MLAKMLHFTRAAMESKIFSMCHKLTNIGHTFASEKQNTKAMILYFVYACAAIGIADFFLNRSEN